MTSPTSDRRQGLVGNTPIKAPVSRVATAAIVLSGEQVIDGLQTSTSRILVTGQADQTTNGIYDTSSAAWTRSDDADGNYDLTQGTMVLVKGGSYALQPWVLTTADTITVGTSALAWSPSTTMAFLATLAGAAGSSLIGWIQAGAGAVLRTLLSKLLERPLSLFDFMTTAQIADVQARTRTVDVTAAVNACFAAAAIARRSVEAPDGDYLVTNLLFGTQNGGITGSVASGSNQLTVSAATNFAAGQGIRVTGAGASGADLLTTVSSIAGLVVTLGTNAATTVSGVAVFCGQSTTPLALICSGKSGANFVASAGASGTLLKAWSCAGVTFRGFTLTTTGTAAKAWDAEWKPGPGPSTQNVIEDVLVNGGTAGTHVSLINLNDTFPLRLVVNATASSQCCIDATQPGGLNKVRDCIWNQGFLRFGCQNGEIDGGWGMGIQYATGCLNYVDKTAVYLYANGTTLTTEWMQSYTAFQAVRGGTSIACQYISTGTAATSYHDLQGYSLIEQRNCQYIGPCTSLLGSSAAWNPGQATRFNIEGGSMPAALVAGVVDTANFQVECKNVTNDGTGLSVNKNIGGTFTPVISGGTTAGAGTYSAQVGAYYRIGNRVFFELRVTWSAHTGTGQIRIVGLPLSQAGSNVGVSIGYANNPFASVSAYGLLSSNIVSFYSNAAAAIAMSTSGDLIVSGSYEVTA